MRAFSRLKALELGLSRARLCELKSSGLAAMDPWLSLCSSWKLIKGISSCALPSSKLAFWSTTLRDPLGPAALVSIEDKLALRFSANLDLYICILRLGLPWSGLLIEISTALWALVAVTSSAGSSSASSRCWLTSRDESKPPSPSCSDFARLRVELRLPIANTLRFGLSPKSFVDVFLRPLFPDFEFGEALLLWPRGSLGSADPGSTSCEGDAASSSSEAPYTSEFKRGTVSCIFANLPCSYRSLPDDALLEIPGGGLYEAT